jgi:DNA-binding ferritin-like protein (Dps family)
MMNKEKEETQKMERTRKKYPNRKKKEGEWVFQQAFLPEKYRFKLAEIKIHLWRETGVSPSVNDIVIAMFDLFYENIILKGRANEKDSV